MSRLDAGGLLYGTIVSAAALATGAGRGDAAAGMIETMASTVVIYWLAHVYAAASILGGLIALLLVALHH